MAVNYGVNATKALVTKPTPMADPGSFNGRLRVLRDKFTLTADLAVADTILMGSLLPAGAYVVDVMCKFADLSTGSGTLDIGWQVSADGAEAANTSGWFSAMNVNTAADVLNAKDNAAAPAGICKLFTAAVQPVITVNGDTDATSGAIDLVIMYVVD